MAQSHLASVLETTTIEAVQKRTHDAIVIGGGAAGGFAAMLLTEAGMRVLVLDAGPPRGTVRAPLRRLAGSLVRRLSTPQSLSFMPPALIPKARRALRLLGAWRQPIQKRCYAWEQAPEAFVDDRDCPYITEPGHPFVWIRARMLGGRVAVPGHGRQYYRLGPGDFHPRDALSPDWPLPPGELDPWYALAERRIGLSGMKDGLPWLPDSELAHTLEWTDAEKTVLRRILARWPNVHPVVGRYAPPLDALEAAAATGNLSCRQGAIAKAIHVDHSGRVSGVTFVDHATGEEHRAAAPLVFLCASALESTRLLMLSRAPRSPDGLGARSGALGHYLMDHVRLSAEGVGPTIAAEQPAETARCLFLSRLDARHLPAPGATRGFGVQLHRSAAAGGKSYIVAASFAEMLPRAENRVTLDPSVTDAWGIPVLRIACAYSDAELALARQQTQVLKELFALLDADIARIDETPAPPGSAIHECGTARMGTDPHGAVLDPDSQCWDAKGLYVTDGAAFPSQGHQNPTLTILALTARACSHAARSTGDRLARAPSVTAEQNRETLSAIEA